MRNPIERESCHVKKKSVIMVAKGNAASWGHGDIQAQAAAKDHM